MVRRIPGMLLVAVGIVFVATVFATNISVFKLWDFEGNLFKVGPAFEELTDDFRPYMTDEAISTAQADLAGLSAVSDELATSAVPVLAGALDMTPDQLEAMLAQDHPAVATGIQQLPTIVGEFDGVVATLAATQADFQSADEIPTGSLPATTVPWALLVAGLLGIGLGSWFLVRPMQVDADVMLGFGVLLIIAPLVLSLPTKARAADDLNDALKPVYTAELVAGGQQALGTVGAMADELQTGLLPALATQLQMTPEQVQGLLDQELPAMSAGLATLPDAMGRFTGLIDAFDANLANYDTMRPVSLLPIAWMMIIGGFVAAIGGGLPLLAEPFRGERLARRAHPTPA